MAAQEVQQLVHGYRRGHEQLAGSIRLSARDADLSARLSDLSGSLSGAPVFDSYLTVYPLPSGDYFALGRTWLDPTASRAGCVLTHTLLVPMAVWLVLEEPRVLDSLFALPSVDSISGFDAELADPMQLPAKSVPDVDGDEGTLVTFVRRYFEEGKRPVVWVGQRNPEDILWPLLRGLWPKLRAKFSACTLCLQPRALEERPFDVMFAPAAAYPRFQRIGADHCIDATLGYGTTQPNVGIEPWTNAWAAHLFGRGRDRQGVSESDLWVQLDGEPTAIRRLFLFKEIMEGEEPAPQVYVGAMDLVESMARESEVAVRSKQRAAEKAVGAARAAGDPASGLEWLRAIEDRLRRSSFSRVEDAVGEVLVDAVVAHTVAFPELTLRACVTARARLEVGESWFGRGVLRGLRVLAEREPSKLLLLREAPDIVAGILATEPELSNAFLRAVATRRADGNTRAELLRWLASVEAPELRRALRDSIMPMLGSEDTDIWKELLKDLPPTAVGSSLSALWRQTNGLEAAENRDLVIDRIARDCPGETRRWARELARWTDAAAQVFAATYPRTRQGLLDLLSTATRIGGSQKAAAIAFFMGEWGVGRLPSWFAEVAREDHWVLSCLLAAEPSASATVAEQTRRLLVEVPDLPVARWSTVLKRIPYCSERPFFEVLIDVTMRSLVASYIAGASEEAVSRTFQRQRAVTLWFRTVNAGVLRSLVTQGTRGERSHWVNAWRWMAIAPDAVYAREGAVLRDLVGELLGAGGSDWSDEVSDAWLQILRRSRSEYGTPRTRMALCVQALGYSFEHRNLPLGAVAAEAFCDVYAAVTGWSMFAGETGPLFSVFDWDKGKHLRRALVDAFVGSRWPAEELVLAARDVHLLRKIFRRLTRKRNGVKYAREALGRLEMRTDLKARELAGELRNMLSDVEFDEAWD